MKPLLIIRPTILIIIASFLSTMLLNSQTGKVGIGTINPLAMLHVDSTVLFTGSLNLSAPAPLPISGPGTRMLWYADKAAFRIGQVQGSQWDQSMIGQHSFASGLNPRATGPISVSMGYGTQGIGTASVALGYYTYSSGSSSTAIGHYTQAIGEYSTALGSTTKAYGEASTSLGINTTTKAYAGVALGRFNTRMGSTNSWVDTDPIFEIGIGTSEADSANAMTIYKNAAALWEGVAKESSPFPPPVEGPGTRMMWYPDKGAFRVGYVYNNNWDMDSVGYYSFASGRSAKAKGDRTTAMGFATQALGFGSTALGYRSHAKGDYSSAIGQRATSDAYGSFAIGQYNVGGGNPLAWIDTDPIFEIGIGSSYEDSLNAITILKNGKVGIGKTHPKELLEVEGAIKVGNNVDSSPAAGTIRWNTESQDFEGYTGTVWKSFTKQNGGDWGITTGQENNILKSSGDLATISDDYFGYSVSISGDKAIVGAPFYDHNMNIDNKGAAFVFNRTGDDWIEDRKLVELVSANNNDNLGLSVGISGEYAIVGGLGKAFVYYLGLATTSSQLFASDGISGDQFGISVAISGDYAIVGANRNDGDRGKAYIFHHSGTTWTQQAILVASDGVAGNNFGFSVDISGDYVVVGARTREQAYIFHRSGTTWAEEAILSASDGLGTGFSTSVAISGDYVIVGGWASNAHQGQAYVFHRSGVSWAEEAILDANNGEAGDEFGRSVAISGDYAIIGSMQSKGGRGSSYLFHRSGTVWIEDTKLSNSDGWNYFGRSVGISGNSSIIGVDQSFLSGNLLEGRAYIFIR